MAPSNHSHVISWRDVENLDREGFTYWHGVRVFFVECEKAMMETGDWQGYVGWRDYSGKPPFLEFAGERRVIVTFCGFFGGYRKFREFYLRLREFGWLTRDMG